MLIGLVGRSVAEPFWLPWMGTTAGHLAARDYCHRLVWCGPRRHLERQRQAPGVLRLLHRVRLGWFLVQAVYETVYLAATLPGNRQELLGLVATWQGPLREIQIHGFALLMILGVSQRLFHHFYGFPRAAAAQRGVLPR